MSTAYTMVGNQLQSLEEEPGSEIILDKNGVASASISYKVAWDRAVPLALAIKQHPIYSWLKLTRAVIRMEEAGMSTVLADFEGIPLSGPDDQTTTKTYSLKGTTSTAPIETHPDFVSTLAGTPGAPLNLANFDEQKVFTGFGAESSLAGVRSYLEPGVIYEEVEVRSNANKADIAENLNSLAKIDTPPASDVLPKVRSPYNWLFIGSSVDEVGDGIKITRGWRLSGRRGWNTQIYS